MIVSKTFCADKIHISDNETFNSCRIIFNNDSIHVEVCKVHVQDIEAYINDIIAKKFGDRENDIKEIFLTHASIIELSESLKDIVELTKIIEKNITDKNRNELQEKYQNRIIEKYKEGAITYEKAKELSEEIINKLNKED